MDPTTAFVLGMFLMLAIGAFLGFIHNQLPASVQPAAKTWRIANLVCAGGLALLSATASLPPGFILPLANGLALLGLSGFVVAIFQFYNRALPRALLLPIVVTPVLLYWFSEHAPSLSARVVIVSIAVPLVLMTGIFALYKEWQKKPYVAALILMVTFAIASATFVIRGVVFGLDLVKTRSILDASHWANSATAIVIILTPIVCTVAFLLMCTERVTQQWREAATTDYLTGLPNRRMFTSEVSVLLATPKTCVAVAIVDVDHFKRINDQYGHDIGDIALKAVAAALRSSVRERDLCSRLGGEEFALAFRVADSQSAAELAERVRVQIEKTPYFVDGEPKQLTASIGVAFCATDDKPSLDTLLGAADKALYGAKTGGRNRVVLASENA
jgi:diguanylate cyclase (GGDEF)-like protein